MSTPNNKQRNNSRKKEFERKKKKKSSSKYVWFVFVSIVVVIILWYKCISHYQTLICFIYLLVGTENTNQGLILARKEPCYWASSILIHILNTHDFKLSFTLATFLSRTTTYTYGIKNAVVKKLDVHNAFKNGFALKVFRVNSPQEIILIAKHVFPRFLGRRVLCQSLWLLFPL